MTPSPRSKSFRKLPILKEEVEKLINCGFHIPFVAITESWLKDHISDTQLNIPNFNIFRSDRKVSKNGGVVMYINKKLIVNQVCYFDDNVCTAVICLCKNAKCIIVCVYRPPNASVESFSNLLTFVEEFLSSHSKCDKFEIVICGDFNLPDISWDNLISCSDAITSSGTSLLNFLDKFFLTQHVQENTRKGNILDLFLTNNPHFAQDVKVTDIGISDHNLVKVFTSYFSKVFLNESTETSSTKQSTIDLDFSKLNYSSTDFEKVNYDLSRVNWQHLIDCGVESFPAGFHQAVYSILEKHSKFKPFFSKSYKKSSYHKNLKTFNRKINRYKKQLLLSSCNDKKHKVLLDKISSLEKEKYDLFLNKRLHQESKAVNQIKTDSKHFFKYASKFKQTSSTPNILLDENDQPVVNHKKIADLLQDQFKSVLSSPVSNPNLCSPSSNVSIEFPLPKFHLTDVDIIKAIDEMKSSSSCAKYDIPAIIFKQCKHTLCKPLRLLWERSFETGVIPQVYKNQLIIPLFKKGLKTKAENYRPVSLTAHVIKIFERVLRKILVRYFEINKLFNHNQHGFRCKRSCSTQLLSHTHNILINAINGNDTDCVYIDFAKAFDKVDHGILLNKLKFYNVSGKYLDWISNFLKIEYRQFL